MCFEFTLRIKRIVFHLALRPFSWSLKPYMWSHGPDFDDLTDFEFFGGWLCFYFQFHKRMDLTMILNKV